MSETCPLCEKTSPEVFQHINQRYYICPQCDLTFVNRLDLVDDQEEKFRYEMHDNSIRSEGYLNFLYRLINPIKRFIPNKDVNGLDFGSGPYPMLLELLFEEGYKNFVGFDPFFKNDCSVWDKKYDVITACEVLEHVDELKMAIENLLNHLKVGGLLVVSSGISPDDRKNWHYIIDPTHISMFSMKTIEFVSEKYHLAFEVLGKDLFIFWKK